MSRLLGGSASPIGWSVQYIHASPDSVLDAVRKVHTEVELRVSPPRPYPEVLENLVPFEAPWARELVMRCGNWTAYLNNFVNGGDLTGIGPAIARDLDVRCVVAEHSPRHGPGHEGTQLWVMGPQGEPPLIYERTLSAVAADGRWKWYESGCPLPFEDLSRYTARRIRDRLDRALLTRYLQELGIPAEDDDAYGHGVVVQQLVRWPRRTVSLADANRELNR
ncbi:hypothetical protein [Micromonospora sp. WMMD812]|uniref:hypothetical protein n=1 Tax=Micromonospora sp. WMMD812 TaxID=3015152 RepID=UPI00248B38B7|nr:hypothetical protein [Micromonospora sp. WMMD812]WBB67009.1 hypothetical protein O7603_28470 [Micromonospora sp. WMMD812]